MKKVNEDRQQSGLIFRKDLSLLVWNGNEAIDIQLTKPQAVELAQMLLAYSSVIESTKDNETEH